MKRSERDLLRRVIMIWHLPCSKFAFEFGNFAKDCCFGTPHFSVAIVLLLNALMFGERELFSEFTECGKLTPNPEIVGSGVRCSMYILLLFVFVSLLVASFHRQQSGTKELGCSVLMSKRVPIPDAFYSS